MQFKCGHRDRWLDTDGAQATALNGKTINDILSDANNALGGNGLAPYYGAGNAGFNNLKDLLSTLNGAFPGYPNCTIGAFATAHLCPICP